VGGVNVVGSPKPGSAIGCANAIAAAPSQAEIKSKAN
jgi:hypothetical protein